jgi:exo-1,4-beta-D-glucosaminidase
MISRLLALLLLLASVFTAVASFADMPQSPTWPHAGSQPPTLLHTGWQIQSACKVPEKGGVISTVAYKPHGWISAQVPSTVLAALVGAKAGKVYDDPYFGKNLLNVPGMNYERGKVFARLPMPDDSPFKCAWWYRVQFWLPKDYKGQQLWLNFGGINYRANIWLNGKQIANSDDVAGAYRTYEFNITHGVKIGSPNVLALEITAPTPDDLGINWVDWNPAPADKDMGLWRGVTITTSGPVAIRHPQVVSHVDPNTFSAELTVTAEVHNATAHPVSGVLEGEIGAIKLTQSVGLAPNETRMITFTPDQFAQLKLKKPELWWPYQMGSQPLQTLKLAFNIAGKPSDEQDVRFGIREVTSELTDKGARQFRINGKAILIRGGGWAPDMMLREDPVRLLKEFAYVRHMGLNTIRLEGKMETDYFYNLADEMGILVMPGWCCCDIWELWQKWTPETHHIAQESLRSQLYRMRNHPSVFVFLNGSDNPPPADVEREYLAVEKEVNWPNPVLSSATAKPSAVTSPSGVKMTGPYDWVPPAYWLTDKDKHGGAWGFNTETSPGPAIPTVESLKKFIPGDQLWPVNDTWLYHSGLGKFQQIDLFTDAINQRYGPATDLNDFERKSQAIAYEGERAMFEAYSRNKYTSTGVIQWMLNNAWPSIIWHLYDFYLDPGAGYFATRKANEPLHVLYGYDNHSVSVVNSTYKPVDNLKVKATVFNFDLTPKFTQEGKIDELVPDGSVEVFALPPVIEIKGLSDTYFLRLELTDSKNHLLSDNFYWLSTKPDEYDWSKSTFFNTPATEHADVTMLNQLPQVELTLTPNETVGSSREEHLTGVPLKFAPHDSRTTFVTVKNPSQSLAFMIHLRLLRGKHTSSSQNRSLAAAKKATSTKSGAANRGNATSLEPMAAGGDAVLPVLWSDNYFSLLPGEQRQVNVTYSENDLGGTTPVIAIDGWNIVPKSAAVK